MNVRRLAAIDMYGARGTIRRRRIILAEFLIGIVAMVALGAWLLTSSGAGAGAHIFGLWAMGAGANYAPLAAHAIMLSRPDALAAELSGVDTGRELRRYSVLQLWIFVPLSLVVLEVRDGLARRAERRQQ